MCQPKRWWIGLLPLAALWLAMNLYGLEPGEPLPAALPGAAQPLAETMAPQNPVEPQKSSEPQNPAEQQVSPYVLSAEKSTLALTLSGYFTDEAEHELILAKAREQFAGLRIIDELRRGAGAPKMFGQAALAGLDQLARLQTGRFVLSDHDARLSGEGASPAAIQSDFIAAMPGGFALATQLAEAKTAPLPSATAPPAPEAKACEAQLREILTAAPIQFETASARLKQAAVPVIDRLAEAAKQCPSVAFTVAGHTDNVGLPERKLDLSRRRAENVLRALVGAGIGAGRLTAAGYGDSQPLTGDDSEEGRAKNRRIELIANEGGVDARPAERQP